MPLKVRGHEPAALYPVPSLAAIGAVPVAAEQGEHQGHRRRRGRGRAGRPAGGAHHAAGCDGERRQSSTCRHRISTTSTVAIAVVSRRAAAGALLQGGGIPGHRERAQQEGVKYQPGLVLSVTEGAQPADEEQQLAQRRLLLHRGEALGRLQHRHTRRVAGVVPGQRLAVGPDHLRLRDHVQRAPGVQHQVDVGERLKAGAEPQLGPADALGHGADPPAPAKDGNDPVRFAQLLRPQHDPVIPVELHLPIVAVLVRAGDPPKGGPGGWVPRSRGVPGGRPPGSALATRAVHRGQDRAHRGGDRVGVDADAPEDAAADLTLHVRRGLGVGALGQRVLGVVEHPRGHAHGGQRVAKRRDGAVAHALDLAGARRRRKSRR